MTILFLLVTGGCQSLNELGGGVGRGFSYKKVVRPKPDQPYRLLRPCRLGVMQAEEL